MLRERRNDVEDEIDDVLAEAKAVRAKLAARRAQLLAVHEREQSEIALQMKQQPKSRRQRAMMKRRKKAKSARQPAHLSPTKLAALEEQLLQQARNEGADLDGGSIVGDLRVRELEVARNLMWLAAASSRLTR